MIVPLIMYEPYLVRPSYGHGYALIDTKIRVCSVGARQMYFAQELVRALDKLDLVNEENP